jgi:hypothetical protein
MIRVTAVLATALALGGCVSGRFGAAAPPAERPGIVVEASLQTVRDVIQDSARQRGSAVVLVGDGLVLERPLAQSSDNVVVACGPHRPGRQVRVVLRTQSEGPARTRLSEERYVVDSGQACPLPLDAADLAQSRQALARIKATSEAVQGRIARVSAL